MVLGTQHTDLSAPCDASQSRNAKRQRTEQPTQYSVSLQEVSGAITHMLNADTSMSMGYISQWNEQLMSLVCSFQNRIDDMSAAPEPTESQPISTRVSQLYVAPPGLASETIGTLAQSDPDSSTTTSPAASPSDDSSRHIPISQRLGSRVTETASPLAKTRVVVTKSGLRSTTCESDYKHRVRRIYTMGLMRPRDTSMRQYLADHGIDSTCVMYSHHIAYTVNEFIVRVKYVPTLCRALDRIEGVAVLRFFDPLNPDHRGLSYEQRQSFPILYRNCVKGRYDTAITARRGFIEYALDYLKEIGI
ncbi:hypothetical protein DL89DRAFT_260108 [Linderina pennispora]|uniref:Uncharacterized protein n=1 Tax=Linderina pennispora TaxID=61395 RepID=A0A1Y1VYW8_9FUNG|nr:uncharacterized protein DL89DRAFT_260108 [Linderina pennispora]ORX66459.1 hypothetical protein DL89DRAFT_260108 [Linderina pennispora]